jgi:dolichyl-phosphate beta-glucosyltransferase
MQKICIIIPCFNEGGRIDVYQFHSFFNDLLYSDIEYDFHFVNDGSTDNTLDVLMGIMNNFENSISILNLLVNVGKAEAVRLGVLNALNVGGYKYVGFWDADLSAPLTELTKMAEEIGKGEIDILIGSRIKRLGAKIERNLLRHLMGRIFATFASNLLQLPVYDTQCGAKLFKENIASKLFHERFISKWIFDVEILFRFKIHCKMNENNFNIIEFPLNTWIDKGSSKIKILDFFNIPLDLYKITRKY